MIQGPSANAMPGQQGAAVPVITIDDKSELRAAWEANLNILINSNTVADDARAVLRWTTMLNDTP
jgi:hypothetical protein